MFQSPADIRRLRLTPKWQSGMADFGPPLLWPRTIPLVPDVLERIEAAIEPRSSLRQGDHLARNGDRCTNLFVVQSGMFKAYRDTPDGREQVLEFFVPGDIIGLAGIHRGRYIADYAALMNSGYSAISYTAFVKLCGEVDGLFQHSMRFMSRNLLRQEVLAGAFDADERVAAFLLNMSRRLGHVGFPLQTFRLPMPRRDIANYLRLAPETVSRIFTRFARCDLILVKGQTISLLDLVGLAKVGRDLDLP